MSTTTATTNDSGTSNNTSTNQRQGRNGGRSRGNNQGRSPGRGGRHQQRNNTNAPSFKGNSTKMNGHVFQYFNEGTGQNQFAKTVETLGEYIAENIKYPGDMMFPTKELAVPTVKEPPELAENEKSALKSRYGRSRSTTTCYD